MSVVADVAVPTVVAHVVAGVDAAARAAVAAVAAGSATADEARAVVVGAGFASGGGVEVAETYDASVEGVAEWQAAGAAIQTAFELKVALVDAQAEEKRVAVTIASGPPCRLASGGYVLAAVDMETVAQPVACLAHS